MRNILGNNKLCQKSHAKNYNELVDYRLSWYKKICLKKLFFDNFTNSDK